MFSVFYTYNAGLLFFVFSDNIDTPKGLIKQWLAKGLDYIF
jgi:hypothetical protein